MPQQTVTLTTIFSDVLANLAFMFTDENLPAPLPGERWMETTIAYAGQAAGSLRFRCPEGFGVMLAANLLGVDPKDDDANAKSRDAVKEFMNIVCGQLVTTLHGAAEVFNLTIPEVQELSEAPNLDASDEYESAMLAVGGHLLQLCYKPGVVG